MPRSPKNTSPKATPRQSTAARAAASTSTALGPVISGERLRSLERQRADLLRRVTNRKKELERLEQDVSRAEELVAARLSPFHGRFEQVNHEVYSLLERLLENSSSKRAHRTVREVFRMLLEEGIISVPRDESDESEAHFDDDPFDEDTDAEDDDSRRRSQRNWDEPWSPNSDSASSGASASKGGASRESLKPLFRKLALELHPDRVQDEREKEKRTRLLKQIVHAYEHGDVATLLQAEKAWLEQRNIEAMDEAAQCAALERLVVQLQEQLAGLRKALRQLRDSDALQVVTPPPGSRPGRKSELERMETSMKHDLEQLTRLRDFVRAYAERDLTLEQFVVGPDLEFAGEVFDFDDLRQRAIYREEPPPQRRRGANRGRRR